MSEELSRKTLREWRTSKFLTQEELAAKVGVTFYTISNWELGIKQPRFKNLRALAAALDIRPEQIVPVQGKGNPVAAA
jgi:transcriptional regulator with XRE-family HTH domain